MKLREILNNVSYGEMTEDELLDLEVKVVTESSNGQYKVDCGIKNAKVEQQLVYSSLRHTMIPKEKNGAPYIILETSMIP